jgi:hypothetical protein
MKEIYENAEEVTAWLGPDAEGGSHALLEINKIHTHFSTLVDKFGTEDAAFRHMLDTGDWWGGEKDDGDLRVENWVYINTLFSSRTWFHRVWIMQEVGSSIYMFL